MYIRGRPGTRAGPNLQRRGRSGRHLVPPATRTDPRPAGGRSRPLPPRLAPPVGCRAALECQRRPAGGRLRAGARRSSSPPRRGGEGTLVSRLRTPRPEGCRSAPRGRRRRTRSPRERPGTPRAIRRSRQRRARPRRRRRRRAPAVGDASPAGSLASCRPSRFLVGSGRAPLVGCQVTRSKCTAPAADSVGSILPSPRHPDGTY